MIIRCNLVAPHPFQTATTFFSPTYWGNVTLWFEGNFQWWWALLLFFLQSPKIMELDAERLQLATDKLGPKKFVSLQQVRKKAEAGLYNCTEELLLDLRTIRHFIGSNCSIWIVRPVIDYIEKIEQHIQMIDLCPHCTLHCLTSGSSWFIQPCPKPHQLVLAQYKGLLLQLSENLCFLTDYVCIPSSSMF